MQVYLSEHIAPSAYARLARHFEIVDNFDHPEQLAAMIIRRAVVPRSVIERAPNLKVIAMHGVSRDTIDTEAPPSTACRCRMCRASARRPSRSWPWRSCWRSTGS